METNINGNFMKNTQLLHTTDKYGQSFMFFVTYSKKYFLFYYRKNLTSLWIYVRLWCINFLCLIAEYLFTARFSNAVHHIERSVRQTRMFSQCGPKWERMGGSVISHGIHISFRSLLVCETNL